MSDALIPITGEIIDVEDMPVLYQRASTLVLLPEEGAALRADFDVAEVEIRPDGLIYLPQAFFRSRLNEVLGIGQWALVQHRVIMDMENYVYFDGSLLIRDCFVARAMGEGQKHDSNPMQSLAAVYESAKSDCIVRCCKDLSIASKLWQPEFARSWVERNAVKVWCDGGDRPLPKRGYYWRRKDGAPFWWESNQKTPVKTPEKTPEKMPEKMAEEMAEEVPLQEQTPDPPFVLVNIDAMPVAAQAKARENRTKAGEFICLIGRHSKVKRIDELPLDVLKKALKWAKEKGKGEYIDFVRAAETYIDPLPF